MNRKNRLLLVSMLVFGGALVPAGLLEKAISGAAQTDDAEIFILEGLKGVVVNVVQPVSGFEDKPNFNPVKVADLHEMVVGLLSNSGVEVLEEPDDDPAIGELVITINTWKDQVFAKFIVQIKAQLYQHAALVRDTDMQMMVPTWPLGETALSAETPVVVASGELAKTVRDEVESQVKMLINDYFEANVKLKPKPDIFGMMTGTIRYVVFDESSHNIFADNGKEFYPTNLPREYRKDGLRVAFEAVVIELQTFVAIRGTPVRIIRITKL